MSWKKVKWKGFIQLNKYHKWQYEKISQSSISRNVGTGKSRVLYGMVYKLLAETEEEKIFISVTVRMIGYTVVRLFEIVKCWSQILIELAETVHRWKISGQRYDSKENLSEYFLVIDEFAALRYIGWKNLQKSMTV